MLKDRIIKFTSQLTLSEQIRNVAAHSVSTLELTDDQAASVSMLIEEWEVGKQYTAQKSIVRRNDKIYRCATTHTSQGGWEPETGGALWYEIVIAPDGILVWIHPGGDYNSPNTGDLRHYPDENGPVYRSKIDGNTTIPGSDERWWELVES